MLSNSYANNTALSCLHVVEDLDTAQSVLLRWGQTVPWTWTVWDDERILDYAIIEHTVSCYQ